MKILLLTYYFPPDLSAGSFRSDALVEALGHHMQEEDELHVVTTLPNRYANMDVRDEAADHGEARIHRVGLPRHQSGFIDQALGYRHFARFAFKQARSIQPDIIIATSSRLMTASLGAAIARRHKARLYLDLRDIFTETIGDVLGGGPVRLLLPAFSILEKWTLGQADRINLVSPAFVPYFAPRAGHERFSTYTNGVDDMFSDAALIDHATGDGPKVVLAAGNMGDGQGLHHVVPEAARELDGDQFLFRLIGGGGRRADLVSAVKQAGIGDQVDILDPVSRADLIGHYGVASILFLHLNDLPAFERVLPSKIFEYAAAGLPIVAGVKGFARSFLEQEVKGAFIFDPCDAHGCADAIRSAAAGPTRYDRSQFVEKFLRRNIMSKMAAEIYALKGEGRLS